jgi:hypothetical protein
MPAPLQSAQKCLDIQLSGKSIPVRAQGQKGGRRGGAWVHQARPTILESASVALISWFIVLGNLEPRRTTVRFPQPIVANPIIG